jgi:hypothetical protein
VRRPTKLHLARELAREILADPKLAQALGTDIHIAPWQGRSRKMKPARGCEGWPVPRLL